MLSYGILRYNSYSFDAYYHTLSTYLSFYVIFIENLKIYYFKG